MFLLTIRDNAVPASVFVEGLSSGQRGIKGPGRRGRGPQASVYTAQPSRILPTRTTMFSRVATFTLAALPLLAAATALEARDGGSSCSTGPIQCCNTVEHVSPQLLPIPPLPFKHSHNSFFRLISSPRLQSSLGLASSFRTRLSSSASPAPPSPPSVSEALAPATPTLCAARTTAM